MTEHNVDRLLDIASIAEQQVPVEASNQSRAVFYEYYGRLLISRDPEQAARRFEQSLGAYAHVENTSICPYRSLLRSMGSQQPQILRRFEQVSCER